LQTKELRSAEPKGRALRSFWRAKTNPQIAQMTQMNEDSINLCHLRDLLITTMRVALTESLRVC